jgi:hypothetical protein
MEIPTDWAVHSCLRPCSPLLYISAFTRLWWSDAWVSTSALLSMLALFGSSCKYFVVVENKHAAISLHPSVSYSSVQNTIRCNTIPHITTFIIAVFHSHSMCRFIAERCTYHAKASSKHWRKVFISHTSGPVLPFF